MFATETYTSFTESRVDALLGSKTHILEKMSEDEREEDAAPLQNLSADELGSSIKILQTAAETNSGVSGSVEYRTDA